MKQPAYVSHFLKQYKPKIRQLLVDQRTQKLLTDLLRKRLQRDQVPLIAQLTQIIDSSQDRETLHIPEILKLCYKHARYTDHKEIQWFLKAKVDNWPVESQRVFLENEKLSLDFKTKNPNTLKTIKFPIRKKRDLPSVIHLLQDAEILSTANTKLNPDQSIEPLNLSLSETDSYENMDQKYNRTLTKVLQLFHFLKANGGMLHSRNLTSPIAQIPLTPLGQPVAKIRHPNIIKKKIRYIRQLFYTIPPLDQSDFHHLTDTLDLYQSKKEKTEIELQVIKHYEHFLRKCYYIDEKFQFVTSKYARVHTPETVTDKRYFEKTTALFLGKT